MNLFGLVLFRGGGEMHGHSHGDNGHSHGHSHDGGHSHGHSHGSNDAGEDAGHSHGHSPGDTNQNTSNQGRLETWSGLHQGSFDQFSCEPNHEAIKSDPLSLNLLEMTVRFQFRHIIT